MEVVRVDINCLADNLICPATVVSDAGSSTLDIVFGKSDGFAIIQTLDCRQHIDMLLRQLCKFRQINPSLLRRGFPPFAFEGFASRGDGNVDVFLGSLADRADDLLCGGVCDLKGLLFDTLNPVIINEPAWLSLLVSQV